jgi:hypothetical protein
MLYDLEDAQELNQKMNGIIMNENNNIVSLSEYIEDKFEGVLF